MPCKVSSEELNEIHKTTDRIIELWRHIAQFSYEHQFSLAKNYQWLNITFLTACAAIYTEIIKTEVSVNIYGLACFAIAVTCSVAALLCSILIISSSFFKVDLISGPFQKDTCSDMISRLIQNGAYSSQHRTELKNTAQWYDVSIDSYLELANKRGKILRLQWLLTLISLILISASLIFFLFT